MFGRVLTPDIALVASLRFDRERRSRTQSRQPSPPKNIRISILALTQACIFPTTIQERAHFRCPSIRETSSEVGARFGTRRGGLFADELIMGGVPLVGSLRRTRLPFPSRVFEILVCAMAAALKQNTKPAVSTVFVIALIPKFPESFGGVLKTRKLLSTKFG